MKQILMAVCFVLFALPLSAQRALVFYAESFRQGTTRITEQSIEAKLDPQNPTYRERIKDSSGVDRYELTLVPLIPEGDNKITSWRARLADLHHKIYDNVFLTRDDSASSFGEELAWLNPGKFAVVPAEVRRIFKVDAFFVTLQVKAYHFTPLESPYLDSMTVQVKFSNKDPRKESP